MIITAISTSSSGLKKSMNRESISLLFFSYDHASKIDEQAAPLLNPIVFPFCFAAMIVRQKSMNRERHSNSLCLSLLFCSNDRASEIDEQRAPLYFHDCDGINHGRVA